MGHEMVGAPSGTFAGHLAPGLIFLAWGVLWLVENALRPRARGVAAPVERLIGPSVLKIVLPLSVIPFEMPNAGWEPMDWIMGWHHITIYLAFVLSGVVDFLHRGGRVSARSTQLALAGAALIGAIMFLGHGNDPGVEGTAHAILALLFLSVSITAVLEAAAPGWQLHWLRIGAMTTLGAWLCLIAWMLFVSGWDLGDHARQAHVWLRLGWLLLMVATAVTGAVVVAGSRTGVADRG